MPRGVCTAVAVVSAMTMLIAAASAGAAQRYASPSGSGIACTQASPCAIHVAANDAQAGDEVIVAPGDYSPPGTVVTAFPNIYMHGIQGQPMPRIHFTAGFLWIGNPGDRASWLAVDGTNIPPVESNKGAQVDQIVAHATGAGTAACLDFATIIDSVCSASGTNAPALEAQTNLNDTITARNLTLQSTGSGGIGARFATSAGPVTVNITNVIAHGPGTDIVFEETGGTLSANIDHSNYATLNPGSATVSETARQTAAPLFVNAAAGDYSEAAGSPTIDAGVTSAANGPFDVIGRPRTIGGGTDIGAYEFDPFTGVTITTRKSRVKQRTAKVALGCPAGTPTSCSGTLTLTFANGKKTAGSTVFSILTGATETLKVKISKKALKRLSRKGKLSTRAAAAATDGAGVSANTAGKLKLKA